MRCSNFTGRLCREQGPIWRYLTPKSSAASGTRHKLIHKAYEKPQWKFEKHFYNIYVQLNTHSYLSERFFITIHTLGLQTAQRRRPRRGARRRRKTGPEKERQDARCRSQTLTVVVDVPRRFVFYRRSTSRSLSVSVSCGNAN